VEKVLSDCHLNRSPVSTKGLIHPLAKEKNIVIARSERLYLTPLHPDHAPSLVKWYNDPEIFGHIRDMTHQTTLEEQLRWIEQTNRDPTQKVFSIFYIPEDRLIGDGGFIQINVEDRKAEVGLVIGEKKYQGFGLGAEALWLLCKYGFEELKFHNILTENYVNNPTSINMTKKIGFQHFGTRRQSRWLNGQWIDVHYSDMLPHELIKPNIKKS
jgi:RimJ/RimL family protein N-acetyltransferase